MCIYSQKLIYLTSILPVISVRISVSDLKLTDNGMRLHADECTGDSAAEHIEHSCLMNCG